MHCMRSVLLWAIELVLLLAIFTLLTLAVNAPSFQVRSLAATCQPELSQNVLIYPAGILLLCQHWALTVLALTIMFILEINVHTQGHRFALLWLENKVFIHSPSNAAVDVYSLLYAVTVAGGTHCCAPRPKSFAHRGPCPACLAFVSCLIVIL
jgi:hypothetical protein